MDVDFITFSNLLYQAIGPEYVQPFAEAIPPGLLNPYTVPNLTSVMVSGHTLAIAWPADHLGWILQVQTNSLNTDQCFDLPSNGVAHMAAIFIKPANLAVFYRLRRP